ncbi:hypothetical protein DL93DRAFT_2170903 [Clavulina sp. PMI_390]|nr:hypothetical protein DL93DRAFT_2170903 [Clavulina sp. PMI_390]
MLTESDAEVRARSDLIALLSVVKKCLPELQGISLTGSTLQLWGTLTSVVDRSEGALAHISKPRRKQSYRSLIDAGLVRRLVSIVVDFAHLEKPSSYMAAENIPRELQRSNGVMIPSPSQSTWLCAVATLSSISRHLHFLDAIVPLAEWRKYGTQLVAAYRASELSSPIQGKGEHGGLSSARLAMINSLGDILRLEDWEPSMKPTSDDMSIMTDALPLLFDLLATIEGPPTLLVSRYLIMTLSMEIIAIIASLGRPRHRHEVALTKLAGYPLEKLIHICAKPVNDSVELFEQRWESLICLTRIIDALPREKEMTDPTFTDGHITGLLQPLIDTHLLTRIVHLIKDIRDRPEVCIRGPMPDGRSNEVYMIDTFVGFLVGVQMKCGLQHLELPEELIKSDVLFLLEWWSLTAPPTAMRESPH